MYSNFSSQYIIINPKNKVVSIKVSALVKDCTGTVNITDIMLQTGDTALAYTGHPSEMKWTVDN